MSTYIIILIALFVIAPFIAVYILRKKNGSSQQVEELSSANSVPSETPVRGIHPVVSRSSYASALVSNSNRICLLPLTRKVFANKADTLPIGGVQLFNEPELISPLRGGGWVCIMWNQKVKMFGYVNVDGKVSKKYPFKNC